MKQVFKKALMLCFLLPIITAAQWTVYFHRAGSTMDFEVATDATATDGFNIGLDSPAPPPPMSGIHAYFPIADPIYPFITTLLHDVRGISDTVDWHLIVTFVGGGSVPATFYWSPDSMPISLGRLYLDTLPDMSTMMDMYDFDTYIVSAYPEDIYFRFILGASVEEPKRQMPEVLTINVSPNPFNSSCEISIVGAHGSAPLQNDPQIEIFDLSGKCVWKSPYADKSALSPLTRGTANEQGDIVWRPVPSISSGVYLVRATIGELTITKRIVYLR